jgi:thymidine phosphorylase
MSGEAWSRVMRGIWLLNTIEVDLSHLGIPLMRAPSTLRALSETLAGMSEQERQLVEDELTRAHASLAQAVGELQESMAAIEYLLRRPDEANTLPVGDAARDEVSEKIGA